MIGTTLGRYRILSELGSGGMGTVYLAEVADADERDANLTLGTQVAVKVVHPQLLATPGFFKRFLREAEVGRQVRHENVVRTLDVDALLHDGRQVNYMVLEYVAGKSLRRLVEDLGAVPEALIRELAAQISAGLAAIHSEGIVHRDMKPENVLLTDDHRVRIMDLGVAKLQEASVVLTREGQFAGSLLYAAPEQFEGGVVGPQADLYSLGVILHELATGTNPFAHDAPAAVIRAHLHDEPPRASDVRPEVSPFLAEVIATLLRKAPAERIQTAADLRAILEEAERSAWWADREPKLRARAADVPRIPLDREMPLRGREADLQVLRDAWARAREGTGGVAMVLGEAGIGKSRLVDAFLREVASDDVHLLYGAYPPSGGLGGISDAVIGKFGDRSLEANLRPYLQVTPSLIPAFAALARSEAPPSGTAPIRGDALQTVTSHLLRALADEKPTLWVVEDLQFAPQESRHVAVALARAAVGHRALLVFTAREELPEADLVHLTRTGALARVQLARLGARDVVALLRESLRSDSLADRLGAQIAYKSDGVPFFVSEMLRSMRDQGHLQRLADGSHVQTKAISEIEVPSAVNDIVQSRLLGLSKEERELLDVGAVQGYEFDAGLVAAVLERRKVRVLQDLADIERRSGLVRGEAGRCRFDHYQIQEVLHRDLLPELRAEYHTLLANALAEREGVAGADPKDVPGEVSAFLARHHLRGSTPRAAAPHLKAAVEFLKSTNQNDAAVELVARALAVPRLLTGEDRVRTLVGHANLVGMLGRRDEQEAACREAIAVADGLGDVPLRALARDTHSVFLWHTGQSDAAEAEVRGTLEMCRAAGDRAGESSALIQLGLVLNHLGRFDAGLQASRAATELARGAGEPLPLGPMNNSALSDQYLGRYAAAREGFQAFRAESRRRGAAGPASIGLVNLGRLQALLGDPAGGRSLLLEARAEMRAIGERRPEGYAIHRLGAVAEHEGDDGEAARLYREALEHRREIRYMTGVAESLVALGRVDLRAGRAEDARRHLQEGRELAEKLNLPGEAVLAACHLARVPGGGPPSAAVAAAREAFAKYGARLRVDEAMEARFVLWQAGHDPADLAEAKALLRRLVDGAPPECRGPMVANVRLHREVAQAA